MTEQKDSKADADKKDEVKAEVPNDKFFGK